MSVLKQLARIKKLEPDFKNCDAIIARNLEMLAIAAYGKKKFKLDIPLAYESLDIHRLLLRQDIIGKSLRTLEGKLCKSASRLWTSSPAFIDNYFNALSKINLPITLIENKVYNPEYSLNTNSNTPSAPPWKIGWFGAIRCKKSLDLLIKTTDSLNGKLEVIIRGIPSYDQFDDFDHLIKNAKYITYHGPYKNPDDLEKIYNEVHFTWAVDMFEEGLNSSWLLPNRLYEGGLYNSVPIAIENVETGRYIKKLCIGHTLKSASDKELTELISGLNNDTYGNLKERSNSLNSHTWLFDQTEINAIAESIYDKN